MAYTDKAEFKLPRHLILDGGVDVASITDDHTLTYTSGMIQIVTLTAGSPKTLMLPSNKAGAVFLIRLDAASNAVLNVNDPNGGSTVAALAATGETAICASNGTNWKLALKA